MAHVKLQAGTEFDFLSSQEHLEHVQSLRDQIQDFLRQREGEPVIRASGPFTLTSAGATAGPENGAYSVYQVPTGFWAYLLRASFDYEGSNAASPVSCDVRIVADANTPAALRALNNVLPSVFDAGRSHAPVFRSGQRVCVSVTGGPDSTQIYVTVQVLLVPNQWASKDVLMPSDGS